jgi:hypothetical protein
MTIAASTADIAALVAAIAAGVLVGALIMMLSSLNATLRALQESTDELRRSTGPLLAEVRDAVARANAELGRVDGLLVTTEEITNTVDSASRLAAAAFSNPVIKTVAFTSGTSRAWQRLRHRNGSARGASNNDRGRRDGSASATAASGRRERSRGR